MKKILLLSLITFLMVFFSCSRSGDQYGPDSWKAKVTMVKGKVEILQGDKIQPAQLGMILNAKDIIKTSDGSIDLRIPRVGIFKIKSNSLLTLSSLVNETKLNLKQGKIVLALKKLSKDQKFEVETPTAVAGIRGTSFLVKADETDTKIGVLTGKIEVRSFDGYATVTELKEVSVSGKELQEVSTMKASTIVDVKDILKIKHIEEMDGYKNIKSNMQKLEIIEAGERADGVDIESLKDAIKAKQIQESESSVNEKLKDKSSKVKGSSVDTKKQKFIKDDEF